MNLDIWGFILSLSLCCVCLEYKKCFGIPKHLECFDMSLWKKKIITNTTTHLYFNYSLKYLSFSIQKIVLLKHLKPRSRAFSLTPHHSWGPGPASALPMLQWPLRSVMSLWETKLVQPALCAGEWLRLIAFPSFFIEFTGVALFNKMM